MAESDFQPGDTDNNLLRKILDAILVGGGVGGGSVSLSLPAEFDVTGSGTGTISAAFASQAAGLVLASPAVGAGVPVFRAIVLTDLPGGVGLGSVTSAALTMPAGFTVTGSPITTAGTFGVTLASQSAKFFLASPTGSAGAPTFRVLAAGDLPAGTGTVTSVAMTVPSILSVAGSPVTTTGTLAVTLATQVANIVFAGPASGGAVVPTFRALVTADMPAGTGTVTSAAMTVPVEFSVAGSPITTTGTFAITKATQTANLVYSGPASGGAAVPTFRTLVAADLPAGTGSGTVTSAGLSMPVEFSVADTPITTAGTLTVTKASQAINLVYASPGSGGAGVPTFRALVVGDLPGGGSGTVTSVAMTVPSILSVAGSPVTTAGTLAVTLATQTANLVFASAVSGGAAVPAFRTLVTADMPAGTGTVTSAAMTVPAEFSVAGSPITTTGTFAITKATQTANLVYASAVSGGAAQPAFRALVAADLPAGTGSGTVTSVGLTAPTGFTVTGSPVTVSGTIDIALASQAANIFLASPSGSAGAPTFRVLAAADLPAGTGTVTSVAMTVPSILSVSGSPVTTTGTLAVTLATQTANTIFAGPSSAGPSVPTFRTLVTADMPAGTGTVTSVALTMPTGFTISGSPVTTTGTLGATLASQSQKVFLASPTASSGAPTFRALVYGDVPEIFEFALSDETTAITTGTAKLTWRAPRALTVTAVRASLSTASSSGIPTVDINEGGVTILSTKLTIDATEKTSTTAAAAAVISDTAIADDAEITFDIDVAGTGATGLKVKIYAI